VSLTFVPNGGGGGDVPPGSIGVPRDVLDERVRLRPEPDEARQRRVRGHLPGEYRDRGEQKTYSSFSYDTDTAYSQVFDSDVSGILIEHAVLFLGCNPGASASCTSTTSTSPK
jgi:hypothetical protein